MYAIIDKKYETVISTNEADLGDGFHEVTALKNQLGVKEKMTLIDTPGYNPNSKESVKFWLDKLLRQIKGRFEDQLTAMEMSSVMGESGGTTIKGRDIEEGKIHIIFHLIDEKDLTEDNAAAINALSEFCPVIPLLSKADLIEPDDIQRLKENIRRNGRTLGFKWYDLKEVAFSVK